MKKLLLFIPLIFFFGCEEEENNNDNTTTGYNCVDNDCFSEEGGQYATLDDCLSVCGEGDSDECLLVGSWEAVTVTDYYESGPETNCHCDYSLEECNDSYSNCHTWTFHVWNLYSYEGTSGTFSETYSGGWGGNCKDENDISIAWFTNDCGDDSNCWIEVVGLTANTLALKYNLENSDGDVSETLITYNRIQ